MNEKIEHLISELLDDSLAPGETLEPGVRYDSSKTVAAKARERIKELESEDISHIKEVIINDKNKDRRNQAYTLLSSLAQKLNEPDLIHFLIKQLEKEKNKSFIGLNLSGISWCKLRLNQCSDIVLKFAENKNSHIKHSAIQVLSLYDSNKKQIEDFLIEILNNSKDEYDLTYTNSTLQVQGTSKSIESLRNVIQENKKSDLLNTGLYALDRIDGANQVDFFLKMLHEKKDAFVKSTLTELIAKHSDERAIEALIDRVKKILSRKRTTNMHYGKDQFPEIVHALRYLTKFESEDSRITKLKTWVLDKKMDYLDETETAWVEKSIKSR